MAITAAEIKSLAHECGFELAGIAPALPLGDLDRFQQWRSTGMAGTMTYMTDRRGDLREDPRHLLASAKTILSVGKLYNTEVPEPDATPDPAFGKISRYAWGSDYHDVLRNSLERLVSRIQEKHGEPVEFKLCVDTAPLLERSYARAAGLGWIGRNTCLINQQHGSWFFLGELLLSLDLAQDFPPPDRCGTCRRCIDACPTSALIPESDGASLLDARLCISYLTIENRDTIPAGLAAKTGNHIFGCDICQTVCPWNERAPTTSEKAFEPAPSDLSLRSLSELTEADFRSQFRQSPVWRAKYPGFLRNVAVAMGNSGSREFHEPLQRLAAHSHPLVAAAAKQALSQIARSRKASPDAS